jgi:hypothetical protein
MKKISEEHTMSEEEYLRTHLKRMDEVKRRWYLNAMKTWTKEDYDQYARFHLWILGGEFEN